MATGARLVSVTVHTKTSSAHSTGDPSSERRTVTVYGEPGAAAKESVPEITPVPGESVGRLMTEIYQTPPEIAKRAADALK